MSRFKDGRVHFRYRVKRINTRWLTLLQEMETNEKLRAQITSLEIKVQQQKKQIGESKTRLEIEEGKQDDGEMMESKGWKSAVVTRMYEERLKALESELEKKVNLELISLHTSLPSHTPTHTRTHTL